MPVTYLKKAAPRPRSEMTELRANVANMLETIETGGEAAALDFSERFDNWDGNIVVTPDERAAAGERVPQELKDALRFARDNIQRFAEAQKATLSDFTMELMPGHVAGQRQIPVSAAGCYVPGGRYSHIASAVMTVTTAKVAGVPHVTAASPPRPGHGIPDPIVYAMDISGADVILNIGGVQALASMAYGLFGAAPADILVGPGNAFVAEAKRQLFGRVGIDMIAGPTDCFIIADSSADAEMVAVDLVSQAEHGPDSPVWLVTTDRALGEAVLARVPELIAELPEVNAGAATTAWTDRGEVMVCDSREEMAEVADTYAPEHLEVLAEDLAFWRNRLRAYGSLFLGPDTTVSFGDKSSGPNHVLPTNRSARYTGGLSVQKFTKTVTWQETDAQAMEAIARNTAVISHAEGMVGHARSAELRLARMQKKAG